MKKVERLGYELDEVNVYAPTDLPAVLRLRVKWRSQHAGERWEADELGGFCLLLKREVLKKIGLPGKGSGLDIFDTAGLCRRAQKAGCHLACCRDLFIHHFGSRGAGRARTQAGPE